MILRLLRLLLLYFSFFKKNTKLEYRVEKEREENTCGVCGKEEFKSDNEDREIKQRWKTESLQ